MSSFLDRLSPDLARQLRASAFVRQLADEEVLVGQGEHGRSLFLVTKGSLEARTGAEVVNLCRAGDVVGEMAFLDGQPRSADLVAREASEVLVWTYETMSKLIQRDGAVKLALLESIAERSARSVRRLTEATVPRAEPDEVRLDRGVFHPGERHVVDADGEPIRLSPTEAKLLVYLAARPGRVIPYGTLLEEVWGYSSQVSSRTVYATVHRLRSKVELDPASPRHIISLSGEGYRFDP